MSGAISRQLREVIRFLVDGRVGIVQNIAEVPRQAGEPDFFHFYTKASNTGAFCEQANFRNNGGAAADRDAAMAKALGEAVERYCAAIYDRNELPLTSFREAGFSCVNPRQLALYSPEQYEQPGFMWVQATEEIPVRWCKALDVLSGEAIWVPAAMTYLPYYYDPCTCEAPFAQPISTGLACHTSLPASALSGAHETIERDALTLFWQAMISPPQILVETLSDSNYDLVRRFERVNSFVTLLDISTDVGIPTVMAVLRSPSAESPALTFAASANINPELAVRKSLEELAHTRRYCQFINDHLPRLVLDPPSHENVADQISHLNFWCDHANAHLADFAFASPRRIEFAEMRNHSRDDLKQDFGTVCRMVAETGHRVLVADLTTPDVKELGLSVVRSFIPGFHPLQMGHRNRALGGKRLWDVPQKLGYPGIRPETGDNPSPHMYP